MSEASRLSAMYEQNATNWEDPYSASLLLRENFRKKKRKIIASEDKAEKVREKFGLGERVGIESLRTPARKEDREEEERAWREVQKERQSRHDDQRRKREREEDQVGWSSSSKGKERATTPSSTSRRTIAPLPSRSLASRSRTASTSSSSKPSPALKALHDKLSLASALKNDPFLKSSPPSLSKSTSSGSPSALGNGVKLVRKSSISSSK